MYKFNIPIGDWSGDGHGICKYYLVSSNKPLNDVRESHFKIKDIFGIDLSKICADYQENYCYNENIIQKIIDLGFDVKNKCDIDGDPDNIQVGDGIGLEPKVMAELWMFLLMCVDKDLELKFEYEDKIDMLPFYGFDKKGRHIGFVGYGLFD